MEIKIRQMAVKNRLGQRTGSFIRNKRIVKEKLTQISKRACCGESSKLRYQIWGSLSIGCMTRIEIGSHIECAKHKVSKKNEMKGTLDTIHDFMP